MFQSRILHIWQISCFNTCLLTENKYMVSCFFFEFRLFEICSEAVQAHVFFWSILNDSINEIQ